MTLGDVEHYAKLLKIKNFRGVFMRDTLPSSPNKTECSIINLDSIFSSGSHWTCYYKDGSNAIYFDSFGDAKPPIELVNYLNIDNLQYNTDSIQQYDDPPICGHLCLEVLRRLSKGQSWKQISRIIKRDKYVFKQWF